MLVPMIEEIKISSGIITIKGTKLYEKGPPELIPTLLVGNHIFDVESQTPTKITIKIDTILQKKKELPDTHCQIRILVNKVESLGKRMDEQNELMWFFNKNETGDKRIEKRLFPKEVIIDG